LLRSYLIQYLGVSEGHISFLTNASRQEMINVLYNTRDNMDINEGDHVLIHYSGHGSTYDAAACFEDPHAGAGSIEALCPVDRGLGSGAFFAVVSRQPSPDISDREFHLILSEMRSERKVNITVILDCCHSGGTTRAFAMGGDVMGDRVPRMRGLPPLVDRDIIKRMFDLADQHPRRHSTISTTSESWALDRHNISTCVLLAACQDTELAAECIMDKRPHGSFTAALMRVLRSEEGKRLTYSSLIKKIGHLRTNQKPRVDGDKKDSPLWY